MKKALLLAAICLFSVADFSFARDVFNLKKWEYSLDGSGVTKEVIIPHDFQMEMPWDESAGGARGFKPMGTATYRTSVYADPSWEGKTVYLDFEGVAMQADIYVNGKDAGVIDYGYIGGSFPVQELLEYGADNEILVKVSTGKADGSRWYTGGGLIRPVRLIVKNPVSIARNGLYVTTPEVSSSKSTASLQVEVEGFRLKDEDVLAVAKYLDPQGNPIGEVSAALPKMNYLQNIEVQLPDFSVSGTQLWDIDSPNLYKVSVSLVKDGEVLDSDELEFGFRTIEYSKEFGFKLNGHKVFLKGMANHHDLGALGAAAYDGGIERMMKRMKEFGYNHIRTSHNPYSVGLLNLADKYGILVVDELYDKWETYGGRYWIARYPFTQNWFNHEREWLKRDRNHPSVILWSFGNETQVNEEWNGFPGTSDWGVTTFRVMKTFAQRYDNTRPFTVAQFPARRGSIYKQDPRFNTEVYAPDLACATDVAALNYRFREYAQYLEHDPQLNIYQSEASVSELAAPFFGMDYDHMIGLAYWGAIEYWGESDGWPKKGWNYSFFNSALDPYPQAYLIKSAFSDEPVVHIGVIDGEKQSIDWNDIISGKTPMSENWNREQGSTQSVCVYSNADEVELFSNGKSLGVKKNERSDIDRRNVFVWQDVSYGKGGKLTAVGRTAGKEVASHTVETVGKAAKLNVVKEEVPGELEYIRVYVTDSKGRRVWDADNEVTFSIDGDASIVAVDDQNHYTDELFDVNPKKAYRGFVMAIVRRGSSDSQLSISSKGFKTVKVQIDAD